MSSELAIDGPYRSRSPNPRLKIAGTGGAEPRSGQGYPPREAGRPARRDPGGDRGTASFPRRPIAFLWHYVRRRPWLHLIAIASVAGAASFACVAQYGLKLIVDGMAAGPQHIAQVWWALAVFAALTGGESVLWRVGSWLGYRAMLGDKAEAKFDLFNHLSGHCSRYFAERMGGALANRVSAVGDSLQQVHSITLFNIAPVCADFVAALAMLATVRWQLVAALCGFVAVMAGMLARFSHRGAPRHRLHADRAAEVGGELVDVLSNIWLVKAFSARTRERARFERLLQGEESAHRGSLMYVERLRVCHDLGLWLMAGGMLAWTLYLWSQGTISPGDVILTVALALRILHGSRDFAFAIVNATQYIGRIAESIEVIGENHRVLDRPGAAEWVHLGGSIAFEEVDFSYPGGQEVFRALNLRVRPGRARRHRRPFGRRKVDVDQPAAAAGGHRPRPYPRRRPGQPGDDPGQPARRHRRGAAGDLAAAPFGARKHPLCPARGERRRGAGRGAGGAVRRLYRRVAAGLRHDRRRARQQAVGRPAATHRHRPGIAERCPGHRARRGDLGAWTARPRSKSNGRSTC